MLLLWDEHNIAHIARHQVEPEEVEQVIRNKPFDLPRDNRRGEERTPHLGETDAGRILFVVTTPRPNGTRVVTAFDADRKLQRYYRTLKANRYEKDLGHT